MTKLKQIRLIVALIFIIALFTSCDGGTALSLPSSFDTASQVSEDDVFSTGSVYESITESAPESSRETNNATTIDSIPKYNGTQLLSLQFAVFYGAGKPGLNGIQ